jgi:SAM-dependent methyltransferase
MSLPECRCCGEPLADANRLRGRDRLHGLGGEVEVIVCPRCGSGVTVPEVPADRLAGLYPAEYSPYDLPDRGLARVLSTRVLSTAIRRGQGRRALRTAPIRALRGRSPGRAVDIGCGRGDLAATLIGEGWEMTGIDPSPAACAVAARRGVDARQGTLAYVQLESASYDAATFMHSLEHVGSPVDDLGTVRRALRPGGLVLITVPNFGGWQARLFRGRWFHLDLPRHRVHFTRAGLTHVLQRAGLQPQDVTTSSSAVGLAASVQYAATGRCLFPSGNPLRVALAASSVVYPLVLAGDRVAGEGDLLHAVAIA